MTAYDFGCFCIALGLIWGTLLRIARNQEKLFELFREWGRESLRENVNGQNHK